MFSSVCSGYLRNWDLAVSLKFSMIIRSLKPYLCFHERFNKNFFWKKGPHHLRWVLLIRNTESHAWQITWQLLGFCVGYLFKNKYPIGLHMIYFTLYCNFLDFPPVSHVPACSRRVQFHSLPTIWPRRSATWTPGAGYSCAESEVNEGEQ